MPSVTVEKFELLPGQGPPQRPDENSAAQQKDGNAPAPPSRHDIVAAVRQQLSRLARVDAH